MIARAGVSALLLALATAGHAQTAPPASFALEGFGNRLCEEYATAFADKNASNPALERERFGHAQWVLGYLSAWNLVNGKRFKARYGVFGDDQRRRDNFALWWVYDVCAANPKITVHRAADELIAWRLKEEAKP